MHLHFLREGGATMFGSMKNLLSHLIGDAGPQVKSRWLHSLARDCSLAHARGHRSP